MNGTADRRQLREQRNLAERLRRDAGWQRYLAERDAALARQKAFLQENFSGWEGLCLHITQVGRIREVKALAATFYEWIQRHNAVQPPKQQVRFTFDPVSSSEVFPEHWYFMSSLSVGWLLGRNPDAPGRTPLGPGHWDLVMNSKGRLVVWVGGQFFRRRTRNPDLYLGSFLEQMPEHIARVVAKHPETPWQRSR